MGANHCNIDAGETAPGYMHLVGAGPGLTRATVGGNVNATGKNAVALTIAAPVPGYAQLGTDEIVGAMNASGVNERVYAMPAAAENLGNMDVGGDVGRIVAMAEGRRTVHLAPGLGYERESGTFTDHYQEERRPQKRARQSMDKEGFTMFSSPHMPLTPVPVRPPSQRDSLTTLETLFMDLDAFLNEGEFKAECERWRECTREEWLRGTEEWSKEFQGLLDLAKDHFTERMISYSSLSKDVADRRAELDRDMQIMNDGMKVVGENLACLAKTSKGRCS
ncbi:hypothetical protein EDC04DRAFT_1622350 [Pisolithus marmoratus]|nr:hypothetical protein EDC04DRAFT_1622350 [Pisolithus marmoratus]